MIQDKLLEMLQHWKDARSKLNREAFEENLRCVVDVALILRESGVPVDKELIKTRTRNEAE